MCSASVDDEFDGTDHGWTMSSTGVGGMCVCECEWTYDALDGSGCVWTTRWMDWMFLHFAGL